MHFFLDLTALDFFPIWTNEWQLKNNPYNELCTIETQYVTSTLLKKVKNTSQTKKHTKYEKLIK